MSEPMLRRDFNRLSAAAFGGLLSGMLGGCRPGREPEPPKDGSNASETDEIEQEGVVYDQAFLIDEPHVCRGLNACKNKGHCKTPTSACKGQNACAGQGGCFTAVEHECSSYNACKGQGGCGIRPGENSCKELGACQVPLKEEKWAMVRSRFEDAYESKFNKKPGKAPSGPHPKPTETDESESEESPEAEKKTEAEPSQTK